MDQVLKRPQSAPQNTSSGSPARHHGSPHRKKILALVVLIIVILGLGASYKFLGNQSSFANDVNKDKYQAVFLTNGQVYFGKIDKISGQGYTVSDIYYLQVEGGVQPDTQKPADANQNLSLAKLGSELHGPDDKMYIESKQVLFWENLKNDSKVVKAIADNKKK